MNKKLLTVAISAAISSIAMTAQADVKVYGRVQAEVAGIKYKPVISAESAAGVASPTTQVTKTDVGDFGGGTLGVSADEDLGGGMKAIGKIEFVTNTAGDSCQQKPSSTVPDATGVTNTNQSGQCTSQGDLKGDREQFVGIQSGMGTLRLGRVNSPYKLTGVALDPFVTTALEARGNAGMSPLAAATGSPIGTNGSGSNPAISGANGGGMLANPLNTHKSGYVNNGIVYNSPKFAGLGLDVYASPDTQSNTNGDISAAVTWAGGPASIFVAYNRDTNANAATATNASYNATAMKVGGQFKLGAAGTISAQWEQLKTGATVTPSAIYQVGDKANVLFVGYQMPIDKWTLAAQAAVGKDNAEPKDKSMYWAAGARYNFSKTFSAYGGVRATEIKNDYGKIRNEQAATIGLRKDF